MITITELKACNLKIENTAKTAKVVYIYVPNKESMPYKMEAGTSFVVETLSAGESYSYLSQATEDIAVTIA